MCCAVLPGVVVSKAKGEVHKASRRILFNLIVSAVDHERVIYQIISLAVPQEYMLPTL